MRMLSALLVSLTMSLLSVVSAPASESASPRHVALIFDDGPVPAQAAQFLELFRSEGIHVTFAYVAKNADEHSELARTVHAAGHEIANHSFAHLHPAELDDTALEHEVVQAQRTLSTVLGSPPRWYWLPFFEWDERMPPLFERAAVKVFRPQRVISTDDWNRAISADVIRVRATTDVRDGTLIVFHEWREETLAQMPAIIAELKRQGCEFLTISELAEYLTRAGIQSM